jgi:hypothetical protein
LVGLGKSASYARPPARMAPPTGSGMGIDCERSRGKFTVTVVPTPFVLWMVSVPLCSSTRVKTQSGD